MKLWMIILGSLLGLTACSTSHVSKKINAHPYPCLYSSAGKGGAFYKDDGPGKLPANLDRIADPIPKYEPLHRFANRPYTVLGKSYIPRLRLTSFVEEGMGSWYGRKFHGQKTSSGELYDMFAMTAAHPTLPIPSYARVTNQKNGRSVVVRINDRGPFHKSRVIDMSFLAACRLGYAGEGSTLLKVETLLPGQKIYVAKTQPTAPAATILPATDTVTSIPLIEPSRGEIFIQLGAFAAASNAQSFRLKVAEILSQPADNIRLHHIDGKVRVRMGPFKNKEIALKEAERLVGEHNLQAVVIH